MKISRPAAELQDLEETRRYMETRPDRLESAVEYWNKPFCVRWRDSHFSGSFMFDTLEQACTYIDEQWKRIRRNVREHKYTASKMSQSWLVGPGFAYRLSDVLLVEDVSSY